MFWFFGWVKWSMESKRWKTTHCSVRQRSLFHSMPWTARYGLWVNVCQRKHTRWATNWRGYHSKDNIYVLLEVWKILILACFDLLVSTWFHQQIDQLRLAYLCRNIHRCYSFHCDLVPIRTCLQQEANDFYVAIFNCNVQWRHCFCCCLVSVSTCFKQ